MIAVTAHTYPLTPKQQLSHWTALSFGRQPRSRPGLKRPFGCLLAAT